MSLCEQDGTRLLSLGSIICILFQENKVVKNISTLKERNMWIKNEYKKKTINSYLGLLTYKYCEIL